MATNKELKETPAKKVQVSKRIEPAKKEIVYITKQSYKAAIGVAIIAALIIALILSNGKTCGSAATKDYSKADLSTYATAATTTEYLSLMKSSDVKIFYMESPSCSHCQAFQPTFLKVLDTYNIKNVYYIDTSVASETDISNIEASSTKLADFGTPTIAITQNGTVTYANVGEMTKTELITFLKTSGIITE